MLITQPRPQVLWLLFLARNTVACTKRDVARREAPGDEAAYNLHQNQGVKNCERWEIWAIFSESRFVISQTEAQNGMNTLSLILL